MTDKRVFEMIRLRLTERQTYAQIGEFFDLSRERVRQLLPDDVRDLYNERLAAEADMDRKIKAVVIQYNKESQKRYQHGTLMCYRYGCKCWDCLAANKDYHSHSIAKFRSGEMPENLHGTSTGYVNWRCRCNRCHDAHFTDEQKARQSVNSKNYLVKALSKEVPEGMHGTVTGYRIYKCRCEACTAASKYKSKIVTERIRAEFAANPESFEHGKTGTYNAGCRCEACVAYIKSYRERDLEQRKARLDESPESFEHGKTGTYALGCRCDPCRAAMAAYTKARKEKLTQTIGETHEINNSS